MQRSHLLVITVVIALVVAGFLWFTQSAATSPGSSPDNTGQITPSAPDPETGGVAVTNPDSGAVHPRARVVIWSFGLQPAGLLVVRAPTLLFHLCHWGHPANPDAGSPR